MRLLSLGCCIALATSYLIRGTSSVVHLRENLKAADLALSTDVLARLDGIGKSEVQ